MRAKPYARRREKLYAGAPRPGERQGRMPRRQRAGRPRYVGPCDTLLHIGIGISEAEDEGGDDAAAPGGAASRFEKRRGSVARKGATLPQSGAAMTPATVRWERIRRGSKCENSTLGLPPK